MVSKYPKVATQHIFNDLIWVSQPSPSANIIITTKIINISTSSHSLLCGTHTQTQSVATVDNNLLIIVIIEMIIIIIIIIIY